MNLPARARAGLTAAILAMTGATLSAGEAWRYIPDDARWAVVVRMQEYLESEFGKRMTERFHDRNAERWNAGVQRLFGIDPMSEVDTVIISGPDAERFSGVTVFLGDFSPGESLDFLSEMPGYRLLDHRGHELHVWRTGAVAYPRSGMAVVGWRAESVERLLDTLDGERSHLPAESFGSLAMEGWFMRAFAEDVAAMRGMPPQATVLQYTSRLDLVLGEAGETFIGKARLIPAEGGSATNLADRLRSLLVHAPLIGEPDNPFVVLAGHTSVSLSDDGASVGVSLSVPLSRLPF